MQWRWKHSSHPMHTIHTELSSLSSSYTDPMHTGHTVLSDACDAFCLGLLAAFCLFCFSLDFPLAAFCWSAHCQCQPFSAPTQPNLLLLLQGIRTVSGPDVETPLDLIWHTLSLLKLLPRRGFLMWIIQRLSCFVLQTVIVYE